MFRYLAASGVLLALAGSAGADVGTPGMKRPKITNRIATAEPLPDMIFIVVRHRPYFAEPSEPEKAAEFVPLDPDHPVELTGHRRQYVDFVIVPRKIAAGFGSPLEAAEAAPRFPDASTTPLSFDESVPEWYSDEFTINYRVQPRATGNGYELVRVSWRPYKQCGVACVAMPVVGGLWLIRRAFRSKQSPT